MVTKRPDPLSLEASGATTRGSVFAAMRIPGYPRLWTSGYLWNLTRWMSIFLCSYQINQLTHSPFLVQLIGATFFAPMFFGGILAGVISDRFDRRRTILWQLGLLAPISLLVAIVALQGALQAWMLYPFVLAVGIGGVLDMTSRRALVYDFVGQERLTNALALEMLALTGGGVTGNVLGGIVVEALGSGAVLLLVAGFYLISFWLLLGLPPGRTERSALTAPMLSDLTAGLRYLRGHQALISILGVTVVMNLCFFAFIPLVPVFAEKHGVGAFWAGLLASANAAGSMAGTLVLARGMRQPRGVLYVGGSLIALFFLMLFAVAPIYPLALLALSLAGVGVAAFGTMQGVLVMISADDSIRGKAMGLMSMAIGALPFAMLLLGAVAEVIGPTAAVAGSGILGMCLLAGWAKWRPESQRIV